VAAGRRRRSGGSPAGRGGAPARLRPGYQPPREASVPWRAAALWPGGRCGGPPRAAAAAFALEGCARQRVAAAPAPLPPPPEQRLGAPRIVIPVLLNEFHNYGGRDGQRPGDVGGALHGEGGGDFESECERGEGEGESRKGSGDVKTVVSNGLLNGYTAVSKPSAFLVVRPAARRRRRRRPA
jgi:hypothetical protein